MCQSLTQWAAQVGKQPKRPERLLPPAGLKEQLAVLAEQQVEQAYRYVGVWVWVCVLGGCSGKGVYVARQATLRTAAYITVNEQEVAPPLSRVLSVFFSITTTHTHTVCICVPPPQNTHTNLHRERVGKEERIKRLTALQLAAYDAVKAMDTYAGIDDATVSGGCVEDMLLPRLVVGMHACVCVVLLHP